MMASTGSTPGRLKPYTIDEYEQISGMFAALYPVAAVPKAAWQWIESAQYRLLCHGAHRALSAVDLLICATAAQRDLVVLLFSTLILPELIEAAVRSEQAPRAADALDLLAETTRASRTDWALGTEARSRALLATNQVAEDLYREAIDHLGRAGRRGVLAPAPQRKGGGGGRERPRGV
jgi:hypothetical protein